MHKKLDEVVQRIVNEVAPDRIILFGSRARGDNKKESDYDLCILKRGIRNKNKMTQKVYKILYGTGASIDIILETPSKYNRLKNKWFLIHNEIDRFGRVIYEK
jgi:predicted nucleotidyltransferase